jgi:organic hydroperoxide reductase OsmC/OhrA
MTTTLTRTLYTAHATVTGGRAGHGRTSDGEKLDASDSTVSSSVELGPVGCGAYGLAATLQVLLPSIEQSTAERLVEAAHEVCPYSNATRGNINVTLLVVGAAVGNA